MALDVQDNFGFVVYPAAGSEIPSPHCKLLIEAPAQGASSTSCKAADRVLVTNHTVTAGGHEFQVATKACSADALSLSQTRALEKRQTVVFNTCGMGFEITCVVNEGTGPLESDCVALGNAITAAFEGPGQANSFFMVSPQFVQEFTLGTCLWAYINENPAPAGAVLEECYTSLTQNYGPLLNQDCIVHGDTGGVLIPETLNTGTAPGALAWAFEKLEFPCREFSPNQFGSADVPSEVELDETRTGVSKPLEGIQEIQPPAFHAYLRTRATENQ
ncbi:hypothetical protein B0H16DRAFT_1454876 [Mycena metata]|uniref:Uncharacterized protein n=1 Tax=Mycena metata TaxID=1033252 RepID=A0AAD7NKK6_9AGAR|nr:hypothetical protein B0H16DRAFT_1454876 [Mycena metata]